MREGTEERGGPYERSGQMGHGDSSLPHHPLVSGGRKGTPGTARKAVPSLTHSLGGERGLKNGMQEGRARAPPSASGCPLTRVHCARGRETQGKTKSSVSDRKTREESGSGVSSGAGVSSGSRVSPGSCLLRKARFERWPRPRLVTWASLELPWESWEGVTSR